MKHIILTITFLLSVLSLSAQIVLDVNDLPEAGDIQISIRVDSAQGAVLQPGYSVTNVLWDFSNLIPCCGAVESSQDTMFWENHTSTANALVFPLSDIVNKEKCFTYHSHETHLDETQCFYNHYIKNNTGLLYYGLEDPVNVTFNNYWNVFPLLSYGDSLQNTAAIHIPVSADSNRIYHIDYFSVADALGTIITPDTTADVIRVYTFETVYDSLYVNGTLQQSNIYTGNYYYRWYTKNLGFPVLEIAKGMQTQQPPFFQKVKYARGLVVTADIIDSNNITVYDKIKVYPNPFSKYATIGIPAYDSKNKYILTLSDILGREIKKYDNINSNELVIDRENLNDGIYFFKLSAENGIIGNGKIVMQ